jgi:hypothetical protein
MKIEVKENEAKALRKYPYLGIYKETGVVVLFTDTRSGFCLEKGTSSNEEFKYSDTWGEQNFVLFDKKIILSND